MRYYLNYKNTSMYLGVDSRGVFCRVAGRQNHAISYATRETACFMLEQFMDNGSITQITFDALEIQEI